MKRKIIDKALLYFNELNTKFLTILEIKLLNDSIGWKYFNIYNIYNISSDKEIAEAFNHLGLSKRHNNLTAVLLTQPLTQMKNIWYNK